MADSPLKRQIDEAVAAIRRVSPLVPEVGVILGTGLGGVGAAIRKRKAIPYGEIPHFPESTVESHKGELVLGMLEGRATVAMEGRFHLYEGYTPQQVTFPVRVMRALGARTLIVSNAAGGISPRFRAGDLVLLEDQINLTGSNPLVGPNDESLGPRFPDLIEPYSKELIALAERVALAEGIKVHQGVYAQLTGPTLETRAEYRYLKTIGADLIGMSTVPEVIVAVHAAMRVLGVSIVTDACLPDALKPLSIDEVIATATKAEPVLTRLLCRVIRELPR